MTAVRKVTISIVDENTIRLRSISNSQIQVAIRINISDSNIKASLASKELTRIDQGAAPIIQIDAVRLLIVSNRCVKVEVAIEVCKNYRMTVVIAQVGNSLKNTLSIIEVDRVRLVVAVDSDQVEIPISIEICDADLIGISRSKGLPGIFKVSESVVEVDLVGTI